MRSKLRGLRAEMIGAVDGDADQYEALMARLRRDELRLKARIERLSIEVME